MSSRKIAAYGTWVSPITSDLIVSQTMRWDSPLLDGGDTYWLKAAPPRADVRSLLECRQTAR